MDHNKQDALDYIRTEIQTYLRRYKRRVQSDAEAIYAQIASGNERDPQKGFDHIGAARLALDEAKITWLGVNAVEPQRAIEGKVVSEAA